MILWEYLLYILNRELQNDIFKQEIACDVADTNFFHLSSLWKFHLEFILSSPPLFLPRT